MYTHGSRYIGDPSLRYMMQSKIRQMDGHGVIECDHLAIQTTKLFDNLSTTINLQKLPPPPFFPIYMGTCYYT